MTIRAMHHVAYKCRDAEETRHFYEDILGMPLGHVIQSDTVPSTGEHSPYVHLFFELADGSSLAFFDIGDKKTSKLDDETPIWLQHFAMEVESEEELQGYRKRLEAAGVKVIGPTDHGFVKSIYFYDPNDLKMEFTTRIYEKKTLDEYRADAHRALAEWTTRQNKQPAKVAERPAAESNH